MRLTCATALILCTTACTENELNEYNDVGGSGAEIRVEPSHIDFGELESGELAEETFEIFSEGSGVLEVRGISLNVDDLGFELDLDDTSFYLDPEDSKVVEVEFMAITSDNAVATVTVVSNADNEPEETVGLEGRGLIPELEIDPDPLDFGTVYVGCQDSQTVALRNKGEDLLEIYEVTVDDTDLVYTPNFDLPVLLDPGQEVTMDVAWTPAATGSAFGQILASSNEPLGERVAEQYGDAVYVNEHVDTWELPDDPPSDILFIVDQSCSMDDDQARLASNFGYFIQNLNSYTMDWQIIVANNDNGCNNTGGILTPATSDYQSRFSNAVQSGGGTYLESQEALLIPAANGVQNTDGGECNAGFMRSDALLHVVLVSDEPEQSGSWSTYVTQILSKKGDADLVKISAIAGPVPDGCGTAAPGTGYSEAVSYTDGLFLSICATDWSTYMEDLAIASVSVSSFDLSHDADEASLSVEVDGVTLTSDQYAYDASTNQVTILDASAIPQGGSDVSISYGELATCE